MEWTFKNITLWQSLVSWSLVALWLGVALALSGGAWHALKRGRRGVGAAFVVGALVAGVGIHALNVERRHVLDFLQCRNHVRSLARSIEMWGEMNGQHDGELPLTVAYPMNLQSLRPDFFADIPRCPAAGVDTYSSSYAASSETGAFTVFCSGRNHRVGFTWLPDLPSYDTNRALRPLDK